MRRPSVRRECVQRGHRLSSSRVRVCSLDQHRMAVQCGGRVAETAAAAAAGPSSLRCAVAVAVAQRRDGARSPSPLPFATQTESHDSATPTNQTPQVQRARRTDRRTQRNTGTAPQARIMSRPLTTQPFHEVHTSNKFELHATGMAATDRSTAGLPTVFLRSPLGLRRVSVCRADLAFVPFSARCSLSQPAAAQPLTQPHSKSERSLHSTSQNESVRPQHART